MQMDMSMVQTSTQYTVLREQRLASNHPQINVTQDTHGLFKTVEGVFMQSRSAEDEIKRRCNDADRLRQDLQRALQENEKLKAKTLEEERSRISDSTMKEELLNNRVIMDGIVGTQTELKAHMKQYGAMTHELKDTNQIRSKRLDDLGRYIEDIKEKQRERRELKKKILALRQANQALQEKMQGMEHCLSDRTSALETKVQSLRAMEEEKAAVERSNAELQRQLEVKLIELTVMNHQLVALVRIFALDLRLADDAQTKSAQSAAACEAERKSIAVQLAKARDEMTLSNSTHETQQNVSHITIKDLETKNKELRALVQSQEDDLQQRQQRIDSLLSKHKADSDAHELAVAQLLEDHKTAIENLTREHEVTQRAATQLAQEKQVAETVSAGLQQQLDAKAAAAERVEIAHQKALGALRAECNVATDAVRTAQAEAIAARQACNEKVERLSTELAEVRLAHESKLASTQSYYVQQLLNSRGQLGELERQKQLAATEADEQRRKASAALAELQADKKADLERHEAQAKELADKASRAEAALVEAQESAAVSAKRVSELDAAIESLTAQAHKARADADAFAEREPELEARISSLEEQLQEARGRAAELAQRAGQLTAQVESLKQAQAAAAATRHPDPPIQVMTFSTAEARGPGPAPAAVRASVPSSLPAPQLAAQPLDPSKVRRRSSSSASKRSVGMTAQTPASIPSLPPASQPDIATTQASSAPQNAAAPRAQGEDKAPAARVAVSRSNIQLSASLPTTSKGGAALPPSSSQSARTPSASSARRVGSGTKKKIQRVSSAARPSDIFDFD